MRRIAIRKEGWGIDLLLVSWSFVPNLLDQSRQINLKDLYILKIKYI